MSSARENARQLLDGVVFSSRETAEEVAAVAQVEAILAVADEIAKLTAVLQGRAYLADEIKGGIDVPAPVESEEA